MSTEEDARLLKEKEEARKDRETEENPIEGEEAVADRKGAKGWRYGPVRSVSRSTQLDVFPLNGRADFISCCDTVHSNQLRLSRTCRCGGVEERNERRSVYISSRNRTSLPFPSDAFSRFAFRTPYLSPFTVTDEEPDVSFDWHLTFSTTSPLKVAIVRRVLLLLPSSSIRFHRYTQLSFPSFPSTNNRAPRSAAASTPAPSPRIGRLTKSQRVRTLQSSSVRSPSPSFTSSSLIGLRTDPFFLARSPFLPFPLLFDPSDALAGHPFHPSSRPLLRKFIRTLSSILTFISVLIQGHFWITRSVTTGISMPAQGSSTLHRIELVDTHPADFSPSSSLLLFLQSSTASTVTSSSSGKVSPTTRICPFGSDWLW